MAKITGALLSLGASGTIGKTLTASRFRGQPYMRQRVVPANPRTVEQTLTRALFTNASNIWKNGPALFTAPWDRAAQGQVKLGRNIMIGRYTADLRLAANLSTMVFSPGAKGGVAPTSVVAVGGALQIVVTIVPPAPPTGWTITSCIAACIKDGAPDALTSYAMVAGEDLVAAPYEVTLAGLAAATLYAVGGWVKYAKPDLSVAYGPSLTVLEATT